MEKLIVLSEEGVSQEFPLTEQRVSIGREEDNIICLGDKSVSRHHASVQRVFRGFIIQDEGSTNGTRVNGRQVTKQFLKHRDLIEIGKYHLRFMESAPAEHAGDADKTVLIQPGRQPESAPAQQNPAPAVKSPSARPGENVTHVMTPPPEETSPVSEEEFPPQADEEGAKIRFLEGRRKGEEVVVNRAFFSVGNPGGDLVLINKRHTGYYLLKVGGDTPPRINGKPIKAGGVELHNGDRIELGELSLEFCA